MIRCRQRHPTRAAEPEDEQQDDPSIEDCHVLGVEHAAIDLEKPSAISPTNGSFATVRRTAQAACRTPTTFTAVTSVMATVIVMARPDDVLTQETARQDTRQTRSALRPRTATRPDVQPANLKPTPDRTPLRHGAARRRRSGCPLAKHRMMTNAAPAMTMAIGPRTSQTSDRRGSPKMPLPITPLLTAAVKPHRPMARIKRGRASTRDAPAVRSIKLDVSLADAAADVATEYHRSRRQ